MPRQGAMRGAENRRLLEPARGSTINQVMDLIPSHPHSLNERLSVIWQRGVRVAARLAIAFGLSVVTAILLGAAVTDNAFAQILVTFLAALGLWLPFLFVVTRIDRFLQRRRSGRAEGAGPYRGSNDAEESWRRLVAVAPGHAQRLAVLRRSIDRSRLALAKADLDPDAHDLCVLIDRRLPELIHRELDTLPPDDRNRARQLGELVDLVEQFARHCSRKRAGDPGEPGYEAAVLRRRFEAHLSDSWERPH